MSDPQPIGQLLDSLAEAHPMEVLNEADEVPALLTSMAIVKLLGFAHIERRGALRMEGAQTHMIGPRLPKHHVLSDDVDQVDGVLDLPEEGGRIG